MIWNSSQNPAITRANCPYPDIEELGKTNVMPSMKSHTQNLIGQNPAVVQYLTSGLPVQVIAGSAGSDSNITAEEIYSIRQAGSF